MKITFRKGQIYAPNPADWHIARNLCSQVHPLQPGGQVEPLLVVTVSAHVLWLYTQPDALTHKDVHHDEGDIGHAFAPVVCQLIH